MAEQTDQKTGKTAFAELLDGRTLVPGASAEQPADGRGLRALWNCVASIGSVSRVSDSSVPFQWPLGAGKGAQAQTNSSPIFPLEPNTKGDQTGGAIMNLSGASSRSK